MRRIGLRHGWFFVGVAAALAAAAAVLARLWVPGALVSGAGAVTAVMSGVWVARGTSVLQARDDRQRALGSAVWLAGDSRLPLVRDLGDAVALGVHPAASLKGVPRDRCPAFVSRDISVQLRQALQHDRFVLLVGESTAGKSRAAFELMRAELPGYRLVQPSRRDLVEAAAEMAASTPRSVLWLDDLERFLGSGGLTGTAMRGVLNAPGGDRFVVATMRSEEYAKFSGRMTTALDGIGREALRQGWDVLRLATHVDVPRMWSRNEIARARSVSDPRLADALGHASQFGVAEYLAAAPQLLAEWRDAWAPAMHPRAAAMILAAVDARRAGVHRPLPMPVLRQLHEPYLRRRGGTCLRPETVKAAVNWATTPLYATSSLLMPANGGFLAFDYLIDALAKDPIPSEAVDVLITFATPDEALDIGNIAWSWSLVDQAESAFRRAEAGGVFKGTLRRCYLIREDQGGCAAAVSFAKSAVERITAASGPDHPHTLEARDLVAWETGIGGDTETARQLLTALAADCERVLGAEHKETLGKRFGLAEMTGLAGERVMAAQQYEVLARDFSRLFGENDEMSLRCRGQVAFWVGEAGDPVRAVRLFRELLKDLTGPSRGSENEVFSTRCRLAMCLAQAGDYDAALFQWEALIPEAASQGRLRANALYVREEHAWCVGEAGDPERAVDLFCGLLADAEELQEPRSGILLGIRRALAWWIGEAGNPDEAVSRFRTLIRESADQRGHDDPQVIGLRHRLAYWDAMTGPAEDVIARLESTAAQMSQYLGPADEVTRAARRELAKRSQQRTFLGVRAIVNREDPLRLLYLGAPEDEYDPEVTDLIKWHGAATKEQVTAVFLRWFGEVGVMPPDMAARIADGINQARARCLPN